MCSLPAGIHSETSMRLIFIFLFCFFFSILLTIVFFELFSYWIHLCLVFWESVLILIIVIISFTPSFDSANNVIRASFDEFIFLAPVLMNSDYALSSLCHLKVIHGMPSVTLKSYHVFFFVWRTDIRLCSNNL